MNRQRSLIMAGLAGLTVAVFARALGFEFVFDDLVYVTGNPNVLQGLTPRGIAWAFGTLENAFWHPLTWLSLMLDSSLYGLDPAGFHATSLLIHLASTLLLFLVLDSMTDAPWKSAAVAALFAVHPLHVESVAWVSERKDVLAAFFWIASMGAYLRYVRRPGIRPYLLLCACFLLGLMAKSMLVTLPFALLLLDIWPLQRISLADLRWRRIARPVVEKLPLLLPIPVFSVLSYVAQQRFGAVDTPMDFPLAIRAGNALASYGTYLFKTLWPARLSAFYPHPGHSLSIPLVVASTLLLLAVSAAVLWQTRRRPWLFTGWFWYLGTLVPVIGLVQLGEMGMADRFTYLPLIGIFIIAAWGVPELCARLKAPRWLPAAVGAAALAVYAPLAWVQVGYWRSDEILFTHALEVTGNNPFAEYNLGEALERVGRLDEAEIHYRHAIAFDRRAFRALTNLGSILANRGDLPGAIDLYRRALVVEPASTPTMYNLATLLSNMGEANLAEAEAWMTKVVRLDPSSPAWNNLGVILSKRGEQRRAREAFIEALRLDPGNVTARANLGPPPSGGR